MPHQVGDKCSCAVCKLGHDLERVFKDNAESFRQRAVENGIENAKTATAKEMRRQLIIATGHILVAMLAMQSNTLGEFHGDCELLVDVQIKKVMNIFRESGVEAVSVELGDLQRIFGGLAVGDDLPPINKRH